jgi:hypothetical protein
MQQMLLKKWLRQSHKPSETKTIGGKIYFIPTKKSSVKI